MILHEGKTMRRVKLGVVFFLVLCGALFGSEMDAKMEAIRKAPPQERAAMMNALKREIATMNQARRGEAIRSLASQRKMHRQGAAQMHQLHGEQQRQAGAQYMKNKTDMQMQMKHQK